jgi:hypothetical protein
MQALRKSFLKKFEDNPADTANAKALELFLSINSKCRDWFLDTSSITEAQAIAMGEAKDFLYRLFHSQNQDTENLHLYVSKDEIFSHLGLGNGANIGSYSTDFLSKLGTSRMSATSSALHMLYAEAISSDPLWSDVESIRSKFRGSEIVQGSRLSFVPKTTEISRTICTEPILNMLFQKGIESVLKSRLREICGIDLTSQPDKNRELARLGSSTGRFGTIDLSSASDSMSNGLVREFFPRHVVKWLELTRSPVTILPDGTVVELHMVSSMGNAFTFPLQTIFFTALVYGVYRVLGIPFKRPFRHSLGNFAVYGDDIIVVKEAYDLLTKMLSLCGFSVNMDKSFNEGDFRESCGRDYINGHDVRGVYIRSLKNVEDCYSAINRLNVWSAKHVVPLPSVISHLLKGNRFLPVPFDEMDTAGIKVHSSHLGRKKSVNPCTGGLFYRYVSISDTSYSVTDVEARPPKLRGWINNPPAVLLAALAGTLRRGKVVTRSSRRSTRIRTRCSSRWDYIPSDQAVRPGFGDDWKVIIELNLNFS